MGRYLARGHGVQRIANRVRIVSSRVHYDNPLSLDNHDYSQKNLCINNLLRSTLGERFVIFGDPVVDGIPVHARREDSRFLVTWTGDVQNLRHFE